MTRAVRLRFFAECRLARGRSAPGRLPRVLGAHASLDADLFWRLLEVLNCVSCAGSFQTLTPPFAQTQFFMSCRKRF